MPIAHIAPAVVAVFVEAIGYQSSAVASAIDENLEDAIDAGELTSAELLAAVGEAQFAEFKRLVSRTGNRWGGLIFDSLKKRRSPFLSGLRRESSLSLGLAEFS